MPFFIAADIIENLNKHLGTFEALPALGWSKFSTFNITQSSPFDLQITGIGYWGGAEFIG